MNSPIFPILLNTSGFIYYLFLSNEVLKFYSDIPLSDLEKYDYKRIKIVQHNKKGKMLGIYQEGEGWFSNEVRTLEKGKIREITVYKKSDNAGITLEYTRNFYNGRKLESKYSLFYNSSGLFKEIKEGDNGKEVLTVSISEKGQYSIWEKDGKERVYKKKRLIKSYIRGDGIVAYVINGTAVLWELSEKTAICRYKALDAESE